MTVPKLAVAEPLLQEAVPRSGAKKFAPIFLIAVLGCVVFSGQVGWKTESSTVSDSATTMLAAPARMQGRAWQPMQLPRVGQRMQAASAWEPASAWQRPAIAWQQPASVFRLSVQPAAERQWPPTPQGNSRGQGKGPVPMETQEDLKKIFMEREALKEAKGLTLVQFDVVALRTITANGANIPEGTTGVLESSLISWNNGEYTTSSIKSNLDYKLVKQLKDIPIDPDMEKLGQVVPEADLQKAYSDLSGLAPGDLVAVMRTSGEWTYAMALKKQGNSRSKTGIGAKLTVQTSEGSTKDYLFQEWDKVKQINPPKADGAWKMSYPKDIGDSLTGKLAAETTNPLMSKIGEECSEDDLQKASADLSSVRPGDVVAAKRSDGKWRYARVKEFIGANRDAKGIKFGVPMSVSPGEAGVGMLLRVDAEGSEKKVLSSEFDGVKAIQ